MDHRAEARAAAVVLAAVSGHEVEGQLGAELHADGAAFAELLDDRVFVRSRLLDRVEPAEGKALGAVDAVVGVEDGEMPAHEVGAHLGLGLEKNVKVGGVDVIVADDDLLAGAHGARKRCVTLVLPAPPLPLSTTISCMTASLEKGAEGASGFGQALAPILGVEHRMASCGRRAAASRSKGGAGRDGQAFFPAEGDELRFTSGGGRLAASG